MKTTENTTATPTPADAEPPELAVGGSDLRLVRLLARFRKMEATRRQAAARWREKHAWQTAAASDDAADKYARCADELERTINGEEPPEPGEEWPR
jgi:hypothetical protein